MFLIEFIEFCRSKASNFVKNRLWHNCLPVNFVIFFTTPFSYYFRVTSSIQCLMETFLFYWANLLQKESLILKNQILLYMKSFLNSFNFLSAQRLKSLHHFSHDFPKEFYLKCTRNILKSNMIFNLTAIYLLL